MSDKKDKDKKKGKIINFVNRSKQNKKIQTDRDEFERLDALAKELVDVYYKSAKTSFFSIGYCFYLFIFRVLQSMIAQTSFPLYRYWYRTASKEVLENYLDYVIFMKNKGFNSSIMLKHIFGLKKGQTNAKVFRKTISNIIANDSIDKEKNVLIALI